MTNLVRWMIVAGVTFLMGQADRLFHHRGEGFGTLLFAPGCLLPFFLWWGFRQWTAALCGAMATLVLLPGFRTMNWQWLLVSISVIAVGFAVELGLTVRLLQRWRFRCDLSRGKDAVLLVTAACLGTVVSGWIVMPIVYWPFSLSLASFLQNCGTLWLMHFVSMVVFAPVWLLGKRWQSTTVSEGCVLAGMISGLTMIEMAALQLWRSMPHGTISLFFASFPLALWGVLRYGMRAAAAIALVTALIVGQATAHGVGPLVQPDPMSSNFQTNLVLLSIGLAFNLVGCFSEEHRDRVERLRIDHALLTKAEEIAGFGSWQYESTTHLQHWSPQFYRLLGLLPEEFPADIRDFRERFIVPDDRQRFLELWDSFMKTGQPDRLEFRIRRTDGRERIVVGQADVQRDPRGRPVRFVGTMRDVTERRLALEDRQRMQDLLNKAEVLANVGSWEMDGAGFMLRWSENMYRICGVEVGDFDGSLETFLRRFVHSDDRAKLRQAFQDFTSGAGGEFVEFRIVHPNGEVRDVYSHVQVARRENGQLVRCYGTTTDVTEQKRAERQLQDSELRYRLLADHASDIISRVREDGVILYISPACEKVVGYSPAEMIGTNSHDFVLPDDRELCQQIFPRMISGEMPTSPPFRGRRKDGSAVWLESKVQPLINDAGRREMICITRDITQRRQLEEQVAQAQRLEAIGRLAGGIAHDFNNILTVINGYAEILQMRFSEDDPAAKYVASILEAGERAAQLTRQLLTYSRKQLVTRGQVNLNDLIRKLQPLLPPLMGETIEIAIRLEPDLASFEASASQLEQLIMNLVINARDAMPDGGVLTLQTRNVQLGDNDLRPPALAPGPYIQFLVGDTGEGMNESVKARVFEPFFTTKRAGEGTGLGLPTVYATVEQCGGAIRVDSAPGQGTQFELFFPVHGGAGRLEDERVRGLERERVRFDGSSNPLTLSGSNPLTLSPGQRILVVEDDGQVRSLVELTLKEAQYHVVTAPSGDDALRLIGDHSQPFDLVLTDVVMKGLNGRELIDRLRERSPHLAVIFMSGYTEDEIVRRGVLHDELTFLQKPFSAEELLNRIRQALPRPAM